MTADSFAKQENAVKSVFFSYEQKGSWCTLLDSENLKLKGSSMSFMFVCS